VALRLRMVADVAHGIDAVEEELDRREEEPAAVLAVGHDGEPDVLLELDRLQDRTVLERAQLVVVSAAVACLEEISGPQEAAEIVGPYRLLHGTATRLSCQAPTPWVAPFGAHLVVNVYEKV
jgi:hypothetical protein